LHFAGFIVASGDFVDRALDWGIRWLHVGEKRNDETETVIKTLLAE
jgi:hypothetical protein